MQGRLAFLTMLPAVLRPFRSEHQFGFTQQWHYMGIHYTHLRLCLCGQVLWMLRDSEVVRIYFPGVWSYWCSYELQRVSFLIFG